MRSGTCDVNNCQYFTFALDLLRITSRQQCLSSSSFARWYGVLDVWTTQHHYLLIFCSG